MSARLKVSENEGAVGEEADPAGDASEDLVSTELAADRTGKPGIALSTGVGDGSAPRRSSATEGAP